MPELSLTQGPAYDAAAWQPFAGALAGAAATLAGLLFVAVSLSPHVFRDAPYALERRLARLAFGAFTQLLVIAALLLLPHADPGVLTVLLAFVAAAGLVQAARLVLWAPRPRPTPPSTGDQRRWAPGARALASALAALYAGLLIALWQARGGGAGAVQTIGVLLVGVLVAATRVAWLLLELLRG